MGFDMAHTGVLDTPFVTNGCTTHGLHLNSQGKRRHASDCSKNTWWPCVKCRQYSCNYPCYSLTFFSLKNTDMLNVC
jgi:predicted RNA-binding Zn-ribbon protein involved in translation (DUF1610 family)